MRGSNSRHLRCKRSYAPPKYLTRLTKGFPKKLRREAHSGVSTPILGNRFSQFLASICALLLASSQPAFPAEEAGVVLWGNDRGGLLSDRLEELEILRSSKLRIEIRGRVCFSTCTMLLGLPNVCVDPETIFGFHGPSQNGTPLQPVEFEKFSRVMAEAYPVPISTWFMATARHRIHGAHKISGYQLVDLGVVEPCT